MLFDHLVFNVTNQAKLYVVQHGKANLNNLKNEIRTVITVSLLSGY